MSRKSGASSLSNGTLSLRFMQRGATQRVAATSAKVVDEAEWDIGPVARAAWGVTPDGNSSSIARSPSIHVIQDSSYLPFVFDRDTLDSTKQQCPKSETDAKPARRRTFRQGTEVSCKALSALDRQPSEEPDKGETPAENDAKAKEPSKETKVQPKSISDLKNPVDVQAVNKPGTRRHRLEGFLKPSNVSSATSASTKRTCEDDANSRGKVMRTK